MDLSELCGVDFEGLSSSTIVDADDEMTLVEILHSFEEAILDTNMEPIERYLQHEETDASMLSIAELARLLVQGEYIQVLCSTNMESLASLFRTDDTSTSKEDHFMTRLLACFQDNFKSELAANGHSAFLKSAFTVLCLGIASLNVYVQANYTGPAFPPQAFEQVYPKLFRSSSSSELEDYNQDALLQLQVDGESPYTTCQLPYFLLLARACLHAVGQATRPHFGVLSSLEKNEEVHFVSTKVPKVPFRTSSWWCARAIVVHERLMLNTQPSTTLWTEAEECYSRLCRDWKVKTTDEEEVDRPNVRGARLLVEYGLAQHYFDRPTKGKLAFQQAKSLTKLQVHMTGSMGKRTKYQTKDVAQMTLEATSDSALVHRVSKDLHNSNQEKIPQDSAEPTNETIQQLVQEGEASYREIEFDQANPEDNILLEHVAFSDKRTFSNLHVLDQIILLSLCLDVSNSNPANDALTSEQMAPYLTRVLTHANNWMVYSTALLERAWLELARNHARERAVLQMQALVDQHSTRLTIFQSTVASIESSAPACDRLEWVYALAYPPQYELLRGLADTYLSLHVLRSALDIYVSLGCWDQVILCYQTLEQPKKALSVVTEQLERNPTPFLLCCLGDLTSDPESYTRAWDLSQCQCARAQRSLGRRAFHLGELPQAAKHFELAVAVCAYDEASWFTLGVVHMRLERWSDSAMAFTRVVQQNPEHGEAWGNLGSVHSRAGNFGAAFSAFQEGLKQKRHLWQMWENFCWCAMEIGRYGDAMVAFHKLLDLRDRHQRPVDHELLAWLVEAIVFPTPEVVSNHEEEEEESESESESENMNKEEEEEEHQGCSSNDHYKQQVAKLLGRMTSIESNNAKLWQIYAHYNDGMGRSQKALDCRLKECRAMQVAQWDTVESTVVDVCKSALRLSENYLSEGTPSHLYSCSMLLRSLVKKARVNFSTHVIVQELEDMLEHVTTLHREQKASRTPPV